MAVKKVLYFLAGTIATVGENADIAKINAAGPGYQVRIRNGSVPNVGAKVEAADYVAGTPPSPAYDDTGVYPRLNVDAIPTQNLLATQAVIKSGDTKAGVTGSGATAHFTVAANVLTAVALTA